MSSTSTKKKGSKSSKNKRVVVPKKLRGYVRTSGLYGKQDEMKFFDTIGTAGFTTTGHNYGQFNLIPQNTTQSGRIGRKCVIKEIDFKAYLNMGFLTGAGDDDGLTSRS